MGTLRDFGGPYLVSNFIVHWYFLRGGNWVRWVWLGSIWLL